MDNGRMMHVLIKDQYMYPDNPDKKSLYDSMTVTADKGMTDIIASVEGIRKCHKFLDEYTYHAYLDLRYDRDVVKQRIVEAVIGASNPTPEPAPEVDATKVMTLIRRITFEANSWGFHEAMSFDYKDDEDVRIHIRRIANGARDRCRAAQAELFKLLGIKVG